MKKKTVFVGLSGGVDSALSAKLLLLQGYDVVGVFIRSWHPDFLKCNEEEDRRDAMRVSAYLGIPFLTFDLEEVYKKEVGLYMINEYKLGRTPNPDVMCNKYVKFGAFLDKAISLGADYVATGHYARVAQVKSKKYKVKNENPKLSTFNFQLSTGIDKNKDQSYFLWTLTQKQLSRILFPIGHLKKTQVRKLAKKYKLPVAEKKDSQGVCFLGDIDLKDFLKHYIKEKRGKVLNVAGEEIGYHDGVFFYTLGERRGFVITKKSKNDKPYYVVSKDIKKNILVVSENKNISNSTIRTNYRIINTNWINDLPKQDQNYTAQVRYHGELFSCHIVCESKNAGEVFFDTPVLVASGQSIVIYDKDICLGGGIVI